MSPSEPTVGEETTLSGTESAVGEGVSLDSYDWAVGADAEFSQTGEAVSRAFDPAGDITIRLRVTDSRDRTDTTSTTLTVRQGASSATMFQYNAANTGHISGETGPTGSVTEQWTFNTDGEVQLSPAMVDGTVYVGSHDNAVYALSEQ